MNVPNAFDMNDGGKPTKVWANFFKYLFDGDQGTAFTPTYTSLTGSATHTGQYRRLASGLAYIAVRIVPDTSTSSVSGTTYLDNFPLTINGYGALQVINETSNAVIGAAASNPNGRIYTPTWTTVTDPITICGIIEAK